MTVRLRFGMRWLPPLLCLCLGSPVFAFQLERLGDRLEFHGFLSQGYINSQKNDYVFENVDGSFEFTEIAFNASLRLNDKLRVGMQLFAQDQGDAGNNQVIIDWAYGDYRWRDFLGFRVGKIKQPLGLFNSGRDADILRTQIFLPQSVYAEGNRQFLFAFQGASVYGATSFNLDYELYMGTLDIDEELPNIRSIFSMLSGGMPTIENEFNTRDVYGGALRWEAPLAGLTLGASHVVGNSSIEYKILGNNLNFRWELDDWNFTIYSIEYVFNDLKLAAEVLRAELAIENTTFGISQMSEFGGHYLMATYRFNRLFELGVNYSEYYPNLNDKKGESPPLFGGVNYQAWQKESTISGRFDFTENWLFKLEWHDINGAGQVTGSLLNGAAPAEDWSVFAVKASYSF